MNSPDPDKKEDEKQPTIRDTFSTEHEDVVHEEDSRTTTRFTDVGPYKLLEKIGEGGMGSVYRAQQEYPIRRQVALKVVKTNRNSEKILGRFQAERQALAMMNHQNIAKILDAGTTPDGSPFFAMELVEGTKFTDYCDQHRLSIAQRLELFIPVCQAVQHAHQKGIIHRDLKPSNVLVGIEDGRPVPKVIDFGLAKAIDHQTVLVDKSLNTEFGKIVGTVQYMSPEQAETKQLDIDTRTDIYSLGVMLYELLTGSVPLDATTLETKALLHVLEIIRDEEPPRPSTRLSESSDTIESVSSYRQIAPRQLQTILRGELDWIVMKALEKDRNRRYESANSFADDLQRYLDGDVVIARPPSTSYKLGKLIRKNRGLVTAAATIAVLLIVGITGTSWFAIQANQSAIAEKAQKNEAIKQQQLADQARQQAVESAKRSADVLKIVSDSFKSANPKAGGKADMTALDVLLNARQSMKQSELDDLGKAELLETLTSSFRALGEFDKAVSTADDQLSIYKAEFGDEHVLTYNAINNLANGYWRTGRYAEAVELFEENLEGRKLLLGDDHRETLSAMNNLANAYDGVGRLEDALKLREQTLAGSKKNMGDDHEDTLNAMNNLAASYARLQKNADALKLLEKTRDLTAAKLGPNHPSSLAAMHNVASTYAQMGRLQEAIELLEQTRTASKEKLGSGHPEILAIMNTLATCYYMTRQYEPAVKLYEETFAAMRDKLGEDHPETLIAMRGLANGYARIGKLDKALELREKAVAISKKKLGAEHPETLLAMLGLANVYDSGGRPKEALELREKVLHSMQAKLGDEHPDTLKAMNNLATSYANMERHQEALELFEKTLSIRKEKLGADHPLTFRAMYNVAMGYVSVERQDEGLKLMTDALNGMKQKFGENHPDTKRFQQALADMSNQSSDD